MEFTDIDKLSILNPIIDEIGVISQEAKKNIITQLLAQVNRILADKFKDERDQASKSIETISNNIQDITNKIKEMEIDIENISSMQNDLDNRLLQIYEFLQKSSAFLNSLNEKLDSLTESILKSNFSSGKQFIEEKKTSENNEGQLSTFVDNSSFKDMKFSELVSLARNKGIQITPRIKKDELIKLLSTT